MKRYGESIVILVIYGKRDAVRTCIVKPEDLAKYPKSYVNVNFIRNIRRYINSLNDNCIRDNPAIYSLLHSLKAVLESKYNVNVSYEELRELVRDLVNDKKSIEFDTISFDLIRKIASLLRVMRGNHTIYDIFDAYEESC